MNELRFRAFDKANKKMYACAGYLPGQVILIEEDGHVVGKKDDDFELMQYLPFQDKNKQDVCIDDIVATGLGPECTKSVVKLGMAETGGTEFCHAETYYGLYLERSIGLEDYLFRGEMYVIGNIWEHPELLRGP